ncbi:carboxypeptidase-like regulatory domain-containing protein [Pseudoduganella sp. LjRoot289]|uniref:carboxypeptidase-like regulatory domain-containing protein n=1 Tax=Pseudoduganella sp. LjRoot289 TaxID=3342314 RepID=UPI003ECE16B2
MANIKNAAAKADMRGAIQVTVHDSHSGAPVVNAAIKLYEAQTQQGVPMQECNVDEVRNWLPDEQLLVATGFTGADGAVLFRQLDAGAYIAAYDNIVPMKMDALFYQCAVVRNGCTENVCFDFAFRSTVAMTFESNCREVDQNCAFVGDKAIAEVHVDGDGPLAEDKLRVVPRSPWQPRGDGRRFTSIMRHAGPQRFEAQVLFARRGRPNGAAPQGAAGMPMVRSGGAGASLTAEQLAGVVPPGTMAALGVGADFEAEQRVPSPISGNVGVSLSRTETEPTEDLPLWTLIRNSTEALSFTNYLAFMDKLFCDPNGGLPDNDRQRIAFNNLKQRRALPFNDSDSYRVLKAATEAFVMVNCGVLNLPLAFRPGEDAAYLDRRDIPNGGSLADVLANEYLETVDGTTLTLPYLAVIRRKLPDIPINVGGAEADLCFGIIQERLSNPCLVELIWSYWQEEGMLVQTMNAITQRFQNLRAPGHGLDPLANTEIDMLRPLNNLLWGYTQDEQHRLTVVRRNYEYDHHYGVRLDGKAVRQFRPADSRSKFLEAFHHLLRLLTSFYKQDDDTTVKADAFPVLNALKEVHLILSQGAHNQFGDLPSTARIEMLMQQWLLGRPEFREFLPTRVMVAYPEPWMDRVDAMKKLQGWTDTSVMHFRALAMFGEQLLLSIRYGNWSDIYESTQAFNWARFWRPQAQGYIHAYRAATGVDLSVDGSDVASDATLPSVLLRQRLAIQQQRA